MKSVGQMLLLFRLSANSSVAQKGNMTWFHLPHALVMRLLGKLEIVALIAFEKPPTVNSPSHRHSLPNGRNLLAPNHD